MAVPARQAHSHWASVGSVTVSPGPLREPAAVGFRLLPRDADDGLRRLVDGITAHALVGVELIDVAAVVRRVELAVLFVGDFAGAHPERLVDAGARGLLVGLAFRIAHDEFAGGDQDELHSIDGALSGEAGGALALASFLNVEGPAGAGYCFVAAGLRPVVRRLEKCTAVLLADKISSLVSS